MISLKKTATVSPLQPALDTLDSVILGKPEQVRLALACVLAQGHLLVEDVPGVGKTTLVRAVAKVLGLSTKRIQFTNDLLPADILGTSIFDATTQTFKFHPGPVFTNVLIADELNRGTPRTQSAFLQAMEEKRVSLDGNTRDLPHPFFVVATQNPREQIGTYPLPESQLDRFLVRMHMGFPPADQEFALLKGGAMREEDIPARLDHHQVTAHQKAVLQVTTSDLIVHFVQRILTQSRSLRADFSGLSPRSGLALLRVAQAWAYLEGRAFVLPEDVQATAPWVINHRMRWPSATAFAKSKEFVLGLPVE